MGYLGLSIGQFEPTPGWTLASAMGSGPVLLVLSLFKKVGCAMLRESDVHPISPTTPAPQYQPIEEKQ